MPLCSTMPNLGPFQHGLIIWCPSVACFPQKPWFRHLTFLGVTIYHTPNTPNPGLCLFAMPLCSTVPNLGPFHKCLIIWCPSLACFPQKPYFRHLTFLGVTIYHTPNTPNPGLCLFAMPLCSTVPNHGPFQHGLIIWCPSLACFPQKP